MNASEPYIRVGLLTDGLPQATPCVRDAVSGYMVGNLLIGHGFHWRKTVSAFIPGRLELLSEPQPPIHSVITLPLEDYVGCVISSEMNPEAPLEFLKAHAVISRSWAMRKILGAETPSDKGRIDEPSLKVSWEESDSHSGFDVCSDDHCQRFQGLPDAPTDTALDAVQATRGLVLKDRNGRIADARFSKCCGGRTEIFSSCWADKDEDYLVSKDDPWCDLSDMDASARQQFLSSALKGYDFHTQDFYRWTKSVPKEWLRKNVITRYGVDLGSLNSIAVERRGSSGRAVRLSIAGDNGKIEIGKELAIRRLLAPDCLYSSWFDIEDAGEEFILQGRGWGHGVGLCQIGAARMAFEGKSFEEILRFYYPDTSLEQI